MKLKTAEDILERAGKQGAKQPTKKEVKQATEIVKQDRADRASAFMEEYEALIKKHSLEIYGRIEQFADGVARATLHLRPYVEAKEPEMKDWHEAMEENLQTRSVCEHKLNAEEIVCEKCGLNPENYGPGDRGVSDDYRDKTLAKIAEAKAKHDEENTKTNDNTNDSD